MPLSPIEQEKLAVFQRHASCEAFEAALARPIDGKSAMGRILNQYRVLHSNKREADSNYTQADAYLEVRQKLFNKDEKERIADNKKQQREVKRAAAAAAKPARAAVVAAAAVVVVNPAPAAVVVVVPAIVADAVPGVAADAAAVRDAAPGVAVAAANHPPPAIVDVEDAASATTNPGVPPQKAIPSADVEQLQKQMENLQRQLDELLRRQDTVVSTPQVQVSEDEVKEDSTAHQQLLAADDTQGVSNVAAQMSDNTLQVEVPAPSAALQDVAVAASNVALQMFDNNPRGMHIASNATLHVSDDLVVASAAVEIRSQCEQEAAVSRQSCVDMGKESLAATVESEPSTMHDSVIAAVGSCIDHVQSQSSPPEIDAKVQTPAHDVPAPTVLAARQRLQADPWRGVEEEEYKDAAEVLLRLSKIVAGQRKVDNVYTEAHKALVRTDWKLKKWILEYGAAKMKDDENAKPGGLNQENLETHSYASRVQKFAELDSNTQLICLTDVCTRLYSSGYRERIEIGCKTLKSQLSVLRYLDKSALMNPSDFPADFEQLRRNARPLSNAGIRQILAGISHRAVIAAEEDDGQQTQDEVKEHHVTVVTPQPVTESNEQIVVVEEIEKQPIVNQHATRFAEDSIGSDRSDSDNSSVGGDDNVSVNDSDNDSDSDSGSVSISSCVNDNVSGSSNDSVSDSLIVSRSISVNDSDSVSEDEGCQMEDHCGPFTPVEVAFASAAVNIASTTPWRGIEDKDEHKAAAEVCLRLSKVVLSDVCHGYTNIYGGRTDAYRALQQTEWKLRERIHHYGGIVDKLADRYAEQSISRPSGGLEQVSYLSFIKLMTELDLKTQAVCLSDPVCCYEGMELSVLAQLDTGRRRVMNDLEQLTALTLLDINPLQQQSRPLSEAGVQRVLQDISYRKVLEAEGEELETVVPHKEPSEVDTKRRRMVVQQTMDKVEADDDSNDDEYESDVDSDGSDVFVKPGAGTECNAAAEIWLRATKSAESDTRSRLLKRVEEILPKREIIAIGQQDSHVPLWHRGQDRSERTKKFIELFKYWNEKAQVVVLADLACPIEGETANFERGRDHIMGKLLRRCPPPSLPRLDQLLEQSEPLPANVVQQLASQQDWSNVSCRYLVESMTLENNNTNNTNTKKRNAPDDCDDSRLLRRKVIDS